MVSGMREPAQLVRVAAWATLGLVAALIVRVVAIDNPAALVVVAPAAAGGLVGIA